MRRGRLAEISNAFRDLSRSPRLLSAPEHVPEDKETEEDLRLLFAP
jgi:hypothetical protein